MQDYTESVDVIEAAIDKVLGKDSQFKVGDKVKWSEYAIRPKRDYWLGLGREPQKSAAKEYLNKTQAARGTVTAVNTGKNEMGVETKWDDGSTHTSLPHMLEKI